MVVAVMADEIMADEIVHPPRSRDPLSDSDVAGLDLLDAGLVHVEAGLGERALRVDATAGVLDYIDVEAGAAAVDRAPGDAEVGRQSGHEDRRDAALLQVAGKPGVGLLVGFEEGRVAVD